MVDAMTVPLPVPDQRTQDDPWGHQSQVTVVLGYN